MKTVQQTLLIINNCPRYTPRIKAQVESMANYARAMRTPRLQTDVGALDFSYGGGEFPRLKSIIAGCLRYNSEHSEHSRNVHEVAIYLINNVEY